MQDSRKPKRTLRPWMVVLIVAGGLLVASPLILSGVLLHYLPQTKFERTNPNEDSLKAGATGPMAKLEVLSSPAPVPTDTFEGPDGQAVTLADFKGKVVVLNLWATWCAPCKEEMPTLAALARQIDPSQVAVVVVNVDAVASQAEPARAFMAQNAPLTFYRQPAFTLPFRLPGAGAMPQTVLIDRQGRVRASVTGAADWSSPQARRVIQALVDEADR